jgi:hypothetical protein
MPAPKTKQLSGPCVEITPSPSEYEQLCSDLQELRLSGAISNTAAILDAVRAAAVGSKMLRQAAPQRTRGARSRSPVPQPGK